MPGLTVTGWTKALIDAECAKAHGVYKRALEAHYREYFGTHPSLAQSHPMKARDLESALPPGAGFLAEHLPTNARHRHYLSGGSSQVIALSLLGLGCGGDGSLSWLEEAIGRPELLGAQAPLLKFEHELEPALLTEEPRVTAIDFYVESEQSVICVEAKYWEQGLGSCSCARDMRRDPGNGERLFGPEAGKRCSNRVLARSRYWETVRDIFFLPERGERAVCPLSIAYQAVRNVAAARALAGDRQAVFVLLYDARNPYFRPTGQWPGWPAVLNETLRLIGESGDLHYRGISWQELLPLLPLKTDALKWVEEKHGIVRNA